MAINALIQPIELPIFFYIILGFTSVFTGGIFAIGFGLADRSDATREIVLGRDTTKKEICLATYRSGQPIAISRFPSDDVHAIRVHWQATYTGSGSSLNPTMGWWMAQLVMNDGQGIHLHGIRASNEAPPEMWLARFERASALIDKPLNIFHSADGIKPVINPPAVSVLIDRLKKPERVSSIGIPARLIIIFVSVIGVLAVITIRTSLLKDS